jgi:hypothetical protein
MVTYLNFESKSTMLLPISIPIHISQYDIDSTNALGNIILASEEEILAIDVAELKSNGSWGRPDNWITARLPYYNFLDREDPEIKAFKKFIYGSYYDYQVGLTNPVLNVYVHGWVNIVRNTEQITSHNHANAHVTASEETSYISGNYCVRADDTTTNYRNPFIHNDWRSIPNVVGDLVLFPSFIFHNTSVNQATEPRLSIAFDIITEEVYETLPDKFKKIFCRLEPQ